MLRAAPRVSWKGQPAVDAECTAVPHGRCASGYVPSSFSGPYTFCGCVYPCGTDADCRTNQACVCHGVVETGNGWSSCESASCVTGADCPSAECGISSFFNGCHDVVALAC